MSQVARCGCHSAGNVNPDAFGVAGKFIVDTVSMRIGYMAQRSEGFFKYAGSIKENGEYLPGKRFASNKRALNSLQIKNPKPRFKTDFGFFSKRW